MADKMFTHEYIKFKDRLMNQIRYPLILMVSASFLAAFFHSGSLIFTLIILWLLLLYYSYKGFKQNIYYLKELKIDSGVEIVIFKYDELWKRVSCELTQLKVDLEDETYNWYGGRKFKLSLFIDKKPVHTQFEAGNWDLEGFKELYILIKGETKPACLSKFCN